MTAHLREAWRVLAVEVQTGSPLDYRHPITHRLVQRGESAPSKHPYFKDLDSDIVAFADLWVQPDEVYLAYITVRPDQQGQGHARTLIQFLYDNWPDHNVDWGRMMEDSIVHLNREFKERYPERGNWGKIGKLAAVEVALDALIPTQSMALTLQGRTYEERAALREDIAQNGITDPILVLAPGDYRIQDGHQRYLIAKALGMEKVPVTYVFKTGRVASVQVTYEVQRTDSDLVRVAAHLPIDLSQVSFDAAGKPIPPEDTFVWGDEYMGEEIGFLHAVREGSRWFIELIEVDDAYQGQGIARGMLNALHEAYPGSVIEHGNFSTSEGRGFAQRMVSQYPEWNIIRESSMGPYPPFPPGFTFEPPLYRSGLAPGQKVIITHPDLGGVEVEGTVTGEIPTAGIMVVKLEGMGPGEVIHVPLSMVKAASTWRGFSADEGAPFWMQHDAVIATQMRGRDRYYEVWYEGRNFVNRPTLAEAKAAVENRVGKPLAWTEREMPLVNVLHYYFGWTTEFTDPLVIYHADF